MTEQGPSPRPLSGSARDRALLIGRDDVRQLLLRAVGFGLNVIVLGSRGAGKTSLLHWCEATWQAEGRRTVWVNGEIVESAAALLAEVNGGLPRVTVRDWLARRAAAELSGTLEDAEDVMEIPVGAELGRPRRSHNELLTTIATLDVRLSGLGLGDAPPEARPVVIVDDLRPDVGHALFGRTRDEVWRLPLTWVAVGDAARSADYLRPPADAFFTTVVELGPLSERDATKVLETRVGDGLRPDLVRSIVEQAEGSPRRLLALAAGVLVGKGGSRASALPRDKVVTLRLRELGPPAERMWAALLALGQASSHDPALVARLGWSRARNSQVLNQLEAAGLVESSTEKVLQGRPRKVYRIAAGLPTERMVLVRK